MPQATYYFPKGFLWGTATSSYQVEGRNANNQWAAWEEQPGRIYQDQHAGAADDWWSGRWKEDFDRAAEAGQNAHRLSIEWSRVQPAPDRWDEHSLDYYREMVRGLVKRNLTPMVTLHHFTDPLWLAKRGGWENDETPGLFAAYASRVVEALKEYVSLWVTINEPNVYAYGGYLNGGFPPGKNNTGLAYTVLRNMVRGHALAYKAIHDAQVQSRVGVAYHYRGFRPAHDWNPLDRLMAEVLSQNFNESFGRALVDGRFRFIFKGERIPEAAKTQDFAGLNYYTTELVGFNPLKTGDFFTSRRYPKEALLSETGYLANTPNGMTQALKWARGFGLPILITENGVEDSADLMRPRYLVEHLHKVWMALNNNWPIKGYFYWTLVDNFEWERGWSQRFGLWGLDLSTQSRIRRKSADLYAAICKENAISYEMVEKYAPSALGTLFPE